MSMELLLAGDIGGTKTRLGLFERASARPAPRIVRSLPTANFPDLDAAVSAFLREAHAPDARLSGACFGLAGRITRSMTRLTNAPMTIDAARLGTRLGVPVSLLNDLEAMAYALPVLAPDELRELQRGEAETDGAIALIAAGTGLGESLVYRMDGRLVAAPSEGGHADWAARTDADIDVLRDLRARVGRAAVEQVLSGPGLVNVHRALHREPCPAVGAGGVPGPADVSNAALEGRCDRCRAALDLFVDAYGAEAGNLALRTLATGGVFIGGGIAPKILPALTSGRFMQAFRDKAPFDALLARIPVHVVVNADAPLVGAAVYAARVTA